MNKFLALISVGCVLLAVHQTLGAPQGPDAVGTRSAAQEVTVVRSFSENNGFDGYRFTYELSDGQIRSEVGTYKDAKDAEGKDVKVLVVQGSYSYVAPDGQTHWVNYVADENGYRPKVGTGPTGGIQPGQDAPISTA
ncbi:endocuticle structural glycoprotein ABD-5-like [Uranotaenia lowii]|uniref:endocuticle structural glycoprotein ABD-5-like n=1 Tax=Uranotaenia lowii TaxID=190385 RepID=UPI00247A521E|nr:endocuticle structural glycoprotein ABD-5-like [Uranotaenia lowii]XP_055611643.1 endocuticle structural glycoprotein ABD-5-like [Uranotaenia lowii]